MIKISLLGKIKTWITRIQGYIGIINFVMIFYLYAINSPLGLEWYLWFLIISLLCIVLLVVDLKFVFHNQLEYATLKNPVMSEIKNNVRDIKNMIELKRR